MKISTLIEVLVISVLIAFVSCKSIESMAGDDAATNKTDTSSTEAEPLIRQALPNEPSIEVVQDLTDSDEDLSPIAPLQEDEGINAVDEVLPEKPAADPEPIASLEATTPAAPILENNDVSEPVNENDPNPINKYCSCTSAQCKCCRDFSLPIIPIRGPGCATIRYLDDDKVAVTIKYGDFVLTSRTINSRRSPPICVPLPGGFNRFCGRVYGISRRDENFKACLGLELRADDEVEASLRVSCFQFGPRGLATIDAEPLPPLENEATADDDDDDDDDDGDDFLGLGGALGGDDDDDDDDDEEGGVIEDVLGGGDDDDGIGGGLLRGAEDFFGSFFESDTNKKKKPSNAISIKRKVDKRQKLQGIKKIPAINTESSEESTTHIGSSALPAKTKETNEGGGLLDEIGAAVDEYDLEEDQSEKQEEKLEDQEQKDEEDADEKESDKEESYEDDQDDTDEYSDSSDDEYNEVRGEDSSTTPTKGKRKKTKSSSYGLGFLGRVLNFFY